MRLETAPGDFADQMLAPAYWLVAAMEWPVGPGPAEAAWAVAPSLIPRDAILLAVNDRAHALICDPSTELHQPGQDSEPDWAWHDRELLRQAIANQLTIGWPAYITNIIELGKLHIAN